MVVEKEEEDGAGTAGREATGIKTLVLLSVVVLQLILPPPDALANEEEGGTPASAISFSLLTFFFVAFDEFFSVSPISLAVGMVLGGIHVRWVMERPAPVCVCEPLFSSCTVMEAEEEAAVEDEAEDRSARRGPDDPVVERFSEWCSSFPTSTLSSLIPKSPSTTKRCITSLV